MNRKLRWSLLIVILAAFAVWLEPTRVAWGWLRGEAFYQGRPTSWWRVKLQSWTDTTPIIPIQEPSGVVRWGTTRKPSFPETLLPNGWRLGSEFIYLPFLDGDPAARLVVDELMQDSDSRRHWLVEIWWKETRRQEQD
jgi:hypothetical protein